MHDLFSSATGRLCHSIAISAASALGISRRLRFSRAASRASPTASPASAKPEPMSGIFGESSIGSFAKLDQHTRWLKTSQGYAAPMGDDFLVEYSETWPKAGTMRNGLASLLPMWERRTSASASGLWPTPRAYSFGQSHRPGLTSLDIRVRGLYPEKNRYWPTPTAGNPNDGEDLSSWLTRRERVKQAKNNGNGFGMPLSIAVKFATPQARDHRTGMPERWKDDEGRQNLNDQVGGLLNPAWVTLLMGFPRGWVTGNAEFPEQSTATPDASTSSDASETPLSLDAPELSAGTSGDTGNQSTE